MSGEVQFTIVLHSRLLDLLRSVALYPNIPQLFAYVSKPYSALQLYKTSIIVFDSLPFTLHSLTPCRDIRVCVP